MAFEIIRNDITKVHADAIVNTANPEPIFGGGTDYAIYQAAGEKRLLAARQQIGAIARGQAVETPAFRLHARYIIHTVGPVWNGGDSGEFDILRSCYENSLRIALKLGCRSIAFPLIATGVYGFPKDKALQIAMSVIEPFLMEHDMKIILVVFDKKAFRLSGNVVDHIREFVDSTYVEQAYRYEYRMTQGTRAERSHGMFSSTYRTGRQTSECMPAPDEIQCSMSDLDMDMELDLEIDNYYPACTSSPEHGPLPELQATQELSDLYYTEGDEDAEAEPKFSAKAKAEPILQEKQLDDMETRCSSSVQQDARPVSPGMTYAKRSAFSANAVMASSRPSTGAAGYGNKVDIDRLLANSEKTFQEKLFEIIDARGLTGPQVYKNYISKQVYSKIQADRHYHPNKYTAIALCLSLHLNLAETQDLIGRAGWTLSRSKKSDLIVIGCILNHEYSIVEINLLLFDYDCPELEKIK